MHSRKNFLPQQRQSFTCHHCGKENNDTLPSPRNHCKYCLYSLHVDHQVPGDRLSHCHGLMEPLNIDYYAKKGYMIIHRCQICGKKMKNKRAEDDNYERIIALSAQKL